VGNHPPPPVGVTTLSAKEVAIFRVIGDFALPPGGAMPGSGGDDTTIGVLDGMMASAPPDKQTLLRALPLVFEHGTALDRFGSRALTQLSPERQHAYLTRWAHTQVVIPAQLWVAAKTLFAFGYFERPEVLEAMGLSVACS
jgi:hypothetical protein